MIPERITTIEAVDMAKSIMEKAERQRAEFAQRVADAERSGCSYCDPTSPSPDPVVVRLENQVADLRNLVETATVLLKEACDSMDESVSKAADGRWYMKKMPSFINIDWQMRAIIWQANAGAKP